MQDNASAETGTCDRGGSLTSLLLGAQKPHEERRDQRRSDAAAHDDPHQRPRGQTTCGTSEQPRGPENMPAVVPSDYLSNEEGDLYRQFGITPALCNMRKLASAGQGTTKMEEKTKQSSIGSLDHHGNTHIAYGVSRTLTPEPD